MHPSTSNSSTAAFTVLVDMDFFMACVTLVVGFAFATVVHAQQVQKQTRRCARVLPGAKNDISQRKSEQTTRTVAVHVQRGTCLVRARKGPGLLTLHQVLQKAMGGIGDTVL